MKKLLCKIFRRHYLVIGTDIKDGYVYVECPYCHEKLFEYDSRKAK